MTIALRTIGACTPGLPSVVKNQPTARRPCPNSIKFQCSHIPQSSFEIPLVPSLYEKRSVKPIISLQSMAQKRALSYMVSSKPSEMEVEETAKKIQEVTDDQTPRKRARRSYFPFSSNRTISRQSETRHSHDLKKVVCETMKELQSIEDLHDRVHDHAYRRMQIFYYQCVIYYKENCQISLGHTDLQHGSSNCPSCSAAHSSILPSLIDNFLNTFKASILMEGLTLRNINKLKCLGVKEERIHFFKASNNTPMMVDLLLSEIDEEIVKHLITSDCSFYDIMNSTVELPIEVNEYDTMIERALRPKAVDLLNEVSRGVLHPYEALNRFEELLQSFFKSSEQEMIDKAKLLKELGEIEVNLKNLEENLRNHRVMDIKDWTNSYSVNSLRYVAIQNAIPEMKVFSMNTKTAQRLSTHAALFETIKSHCSKERIYLDRIEKLKDLQAYTKNILSRSQKLGIVNEELGTTLKNCRTETSFLPLKQHLKKFWELCDQAEFLLCDPEKTKALFNSISDGVALLPNWSPDRITDQLGRLQESIQICRLQSKASISPPFAHLSGSLVDGQLIPLDDEALFYQKMELWRRV